MSPFIPSTQPLPLSRLRPFVRRVRLFSPLRWCALLMITSSALSVTAHAQQSPPGPDSTPTLGLSASSAINVHAGVGQMKHAALGTEVGGALDLGSIGSRRVRLAVGIDYLGVSIDRRDSLGVRERGRGYVFTASADVAAIPSLNHRITPYGGAGVGVDAVGTTISNEQVGALYNTNVFNLHAQLGLLYRVTPTGRVSIEARVTGARVVRRVGVRLGYTLFYNQLR